MQSARLFHRAVGVECGEKAWRHDTRALFGLWIVSLICEAGALVLTLTS
jgi:hypothetical protein